MSFMSRIFNFFTPSTNEKKHVRLSPSAISMERDRTLRKIASLHPIQNFRNEFRMVALEEAGKVRLTLKQSSRLTKKANYLWKNMAKDAKSKYYDLAKNCQKTRIPGLTLQKLLLQNTPSKVPVNPRSNIDQAIGGQVDPPPPTNSCLVDETTRRQAAKRKHSDESDIPTVLEDSLVTTIRALEGPDKKRPRRE
ncbi:uncharacterized protein LOC111070366 [Drosophila obscura]|uniref:uncharacterized protein LOC111070366 n=1 Tax=Drosophila obscura TaxID=7282 RepID=UPI000B9FFB1C|nr:uncharacterized protein LOC111070366 [Drosophila obscura]